MNQTRGRETLYRGVKMRSRLEADYAGYLDHRGIDWEYEAACFAGPDGQWLPDFRSSNGLVYTEVKSDHLLKPLPDEGPHEMVERIDAILCQMKVAWLSEPGVYLHLIFWSYGASEPTMKIIGTPHGPWLAATPDSPAGIPMLWIGMDQMAAFDQGFNFSGELGTGPCPRCTPVAAAS